MRRIGDSVLSVRIDLLAEGLEGFADGPAVSLPGTPRVQALWPEPSPVFVIPKLSQSASFCIQGSSVNSGV